MRGIGRWRWRWLRRASQILFLALFLAAFRLTDYRGQDEIPYAVNVFFRWDPLLALSVTAAARRLVGLLAPALVVAGLTVLLGRVFCGWVCPLGTLLDGAGRLVPASGRPMPPGLRRVKYGLLVLTLAGAVAGVPLAGLIDPLALLVRGLALAVDPLLAGAAGAFFDLLYREAPEAVSAVSEPVYGWLRDRLLPFRQASFELAGLSLLLLAAIFALERLERRFWCRNLCPLGALLALLGRRSLLRRRPERACSDCGACWDDCRMRAVAESGHVLESDCIRCLDCGPNCARELAGFRIGLGRRRRPAATPALGLTRRAFFASAAAGLTLPAVGRVLPWRRFPRPAALRPPGALPEDQFLATCVRCGECLKVCVGNALQPALGQTGATGLYTPILVPRVGYCEYNCSLCGQVCPSGAIRQLPLAEKQAFVIGTARIDRSLCLPYARGIPCIVCEEHCPIYDKAIQLRPVSTQDEAGRPVDLQLPYVVDERCNGCGACENKCPLPGRAAIRVESTWDPRN